MMKSSPARGAEPASRLRNMPSENWKALQNKLRKGPRKLAKPTKAAALTSSERDAQYPVGAELELFRRNNTASLDQILQREDGSLLTATKASSSAFKSKTGTFVAMDCEFVGTGPNGSVSELARVSIVNYYGHVIYDVYVKPRSLVTDFRTKYSGILPSHLRDAIPFKEAQEKVSELLHKKTLIGHGISNDLKVLFLSHPRASIIDTQRLQRFTQNQNIKGKPGLKRVLECYFGLGIQLGPHDSVEDARSTMLIFRAFKAEYLQQNQRRSK